MQTIPEIVVQLVHIEGPLKGEILEFSENEILIGRHPQCHLLFPPELDIISRKHARIVREGNRFKLIDHSTNGTYVNGKRVQESFLKNGDVLMLADGGPKVSFLTQITERPQARDMPRPHPQARVQPSRPRSAPIQTRKPPDSQSQESPVSTKELLMDANQAPLVIQYGPTLRSFKKLPVTIGRSSHCDVMLNYPAILDMHAEIFFSQNQYWIKDLTGQNRVSVNGAPLHHPVPLTAATRISLSPQGPTFQFLEGGRLAEIEEANAAISESGSAPPDNRASTENKASKPPSGSGGIIKKFFKS